jgi:hypothetical protein
MKGSENTHAPIKIIPAYSEIVPADIDLIPATPQQVTATLTSFPLNWKLAPKGFQNLWGLERR